MKLTTPCLLLLASFLFTGCASFNQIFTAKYGLPKTKQMIPARVTVDEAVEGRPSVGLPITIEKQRVVMMPFALEYQKRWLERPDQYQEKRSGAYSSYSYSQPSYHAATHGSSVRWHNVIFKNLDSGQEWLLLDRRGIITKYQVASTRKKVDDEWEFTPKILLFDATRSDTDKDGALTSDDATTLLVADPDGGNIRAVTPPRMDCVSYRWNEDTELVFLQVRRDTNGDGVFDALDESAPYRLDLGAAKAVPMVTPAIQSEAAGLLR